MESKKFIRPLAAALGCAGAAVAAPVLAPYLATVSLPFFGAVLASVFKAEDFKENFGKVIVNTVAGFLTNLGSAAAVQIPGALGADHNSHLEKMLATACLESLESIEKEINAGKDEELKKQAAEVFPRLKNRIKRGLRASGLSLLFPLQSKEQPLETAFANRFSAENITLLIADEEKWHEQLGDEVEISLRRWLNEERAEEERAAGQTQLGIPPDGPLEEPLRKRLRAELPDRIAHRISELVKRDDFNKSWIAFQRAHLQGIVRVVERIETSQADMKQSVYALAQRIEGFANEDRFVDAIAEKLREFLGKTALPPDGLRQLLERQSYELTNELGHIEERLKKEIEESKIEVIAEIGESEKVVVGEIRVATDKLTEEIQKAILQGASRSARNRLKQLPAPPRDFTGREAELDELRQALLQGGVTISGVQGMGGVGKTALALVLADEFKDQYPDAQIYLDLKGVSKQPLSPAEVMWHVVSSFQPEMKRPDDGQLPAWYNSLLNNNCVLLFYDNARDAAQIAHLLPPEHCLLLVTSRKHFTLPEMFGSNLDEMTAADASELVLRIAPRIGEHAAAIAEQCAYLPIALRAAASALKVKRSLSAEDYLERLRDRIERLKLYDAVSNLTVEACFSLSYELLNEELQRRWRMLAIFPTDFDALAAAAVWPTDVDASKDSLSELEEYSLLEWGKNEQRYSLHDLARDFADARLSASEREQAGTLHATHYLQILSTANGLYLTGSEAIAEGLSLFDNERINIQAGQEWATARFAGDEQAARLCDGYAHYGADILNLRQHPRDFIHWQEAALHSARRLHDSQSEGSRLGNLGVAHDSLGEARIAIDYHEQALAISRELGNRGSEGVHLGNLGNAYDNLGESRSAINYYQQALAISREIGDRRGEGKRLGNLGIAYCNIGEVRTAIDYYKQALQVSREIGEKRYEGNWLGSLGSAFYSLGDIRAAIDYLQQALANSREIGDLRNEGIWLGNLGLAYVDLGKISTAIDYHKQALQVSREIGDRKNEGTHLGNLGIAYKLSGEVRTAIDLYEQALAISREIGDKRGEGNCLGNLGYTYATSGKTEKAIEFMEASLKILEEIESPNANTARGWLEKLRGKSE